LPIINGIAFDEKGARFTNLDSIATCQDLCTDGEKFVLDMKKLDAVCKASKDPLVAVSIVSGEKVKVDKFTLSTMDYGQFPIIPEFVAGESGGVITNEKVVVLQKIIMNVLEKKERGLVYSICFKGDQFFGTDGGIIAMVKNLQINTGSDISFMLEHSALSGLEGFDKLTMTFEVAKHRKAVKFIQDNLELICHTSDYAIPNIWRVLYDDFDASFEVNVKLLKKELKTAKRIFKDSAFLPFNNFADNGIFSVIHEGEEMELEGISGAYGFLYRFSGYSMLKILETTDKDFLTFNFGKPGERGVAQMPIAETKDELYLICPMRRRR